MVTVIYYYYYHYYYYYCYYYYYFINLVFALADLIPIFTHKASHNKLPKVYGFIVHLLCFQKPVPSYTFTIFFTFSSSHLFFPFPNPISTNLIRNLKPSLIYELSLVVLFSSVMLCL